MNKLVIKEWFARKTSFGVSPTAHKIIYNEDTGISILVCRGVSGGHYAKGQIVEVKGKPDPEQICALCAKADGADIIGNIIMEQSKREALEEAQAKARHEEKIRLETEREENRAANAKAEADKDNTDEEDVSV